MGQEEAVIRVVDEVWGNRFKQNSVAVKRNGLIMLAMNHHERASRNAGHVPQWVELSRKEAEF
jgi:hypothetical protein